MVAAWCLSVIVQPRVVGFFVNDFYRSDTFFQLSVQARVGLVVLCVVGIGIALLLVWSISANTARIAFTFARQRQSLKVWAPVSILFFSNIALVLLCLVVLASITPQILYTYYQTVFSDLPQQWLMLSPSFEILNLPFRKSPITDLYEAVSVTSVVAAIALCCYTWIVSFVSDR